MRRLGGPWGAAGGGVTGRRPERLLQGGGDGRGRRYWTAEGALSGPSRARRWEGGLTLAASGGRGCGPAGRPLRGAEGDGRAGPDPGGLLPGRETGVAGGAGPRRGRSAARHGRAGGRGTDPCGKRGARVWARREAPKGGQRATAGQVLILMAFSRGGRRAWPAVLDRGGGAQRPVTGAPVGWRPVTLAESGGRGCGPAGRHLGRGRTRGGDRDARGRGGDGPGAWGGYQPPASGAFSGPERACGGRLEAPKGRQRVAAGQVADLRARNAGMRARAYRGRAGRAVRSRRAEQGGAEHASRGSHGARRRRPGTGQGIEGKKKKKEKEGGGGQWRATICFSY